MAEERLVWYHNVPLGTNEEAQGGAPGFEGVHLMNLRTIYLAVWGFASALPPFTNTYKY